MINNDRGPRSQRALKAEKQALSLFEQSQRLRCA
jgi:hypothetical protein